MRKFFSLVAAALVVGLSTGTASAASLVNLEVLGSTTAGGTYSSSLQVAAGQTYYYEVVAQYAPINTSNGNGKTITSLSPTLDGISSLSLNVNNTSGNPIPVTFTGSAALTNGFQSGTGAQGGTVAGNGEGITNIRPIQAPGSLAGATGPVVVLTGSFTTPSSLADGLSSAISLAFGGTLSGFKINGGSSVVVNATTEGGANPYFGYQALTLTTPAAAVPEPSSVVMMGLSSVGVAGLMVVRRRKALKV